MAEKWTPGPWERHGTLVCANRPVDGGTICQVSEVRHTNFVQHREPNLGSSDSDEIHANAGLIAAAPELYSALVAVSGMLFQRPDMMAALRPLMGPAEMAVCDAAAAALAKATGAKP